MTMLLMIDNYDSFTYNLVQYFGELGAKVKVFRNDEITLDTDRCASRPRTSSSRPGRARRPRPASRWRRSRPSPASCPSSACASATRASARPLAGASCTRSKLMHGKTSPVHHLDAGVFRGLPNPLTCTRYHSLAIERSSLPDCLEVTAWTDDGEIMGVRHGRWTSRACSSTPSPSSPSMRPRLLKNFLDRGARLPAAA
jgi:anthranilate synthase component 2